MRILFIAPLPPPTTGQSIASSAIFERLTKTHDVSVVNFSKGTFRQGVNSFRRIFEVGKYIVSIICAARKSDVVYLTISQSLAGVLKDILIYIFCFKRLHSFVLHSHGNGIKKIVFDRYIFIERLTSFFYKRITRLIVLGPSHVDVFSGVMQKNKIRIVYNFADDDLFFDDKQITTKFNIIKDRVNLLFLSNLLPGKGHWELVDAFDALAEPVKAKLYLTFAGGFESKDEEKRFLGRIQDMPNVHYCGIVDKAKKVELFQMAHVFCLPTSYPYEGQPISILEAYASGCVVITTSHAGIPDVFTGGVHGFEVEKNSSNSISEAILNLEKKPELYLKFALSNALEARTKYREDRFSQSVEHILESVYLLRHRA